MKSDTVTQALESWRSIDREVNGVPKPSSSNEGKDTGTASAHRADWQHVIDQKLTVWEGDPSALEDEGVDPPSAAIIERAINFARSLQQAGYPPPTNVVPDPNGGIVFERTGNGSSEEFHFWDDGTADYCRYEGTRLLERRPI
jgi:hypothetical protein